METHKYLLFVSAILTAAIIQTLTPLLIMSMAYDPSDLSLTKVLYAVNTTGDAWYPVTTGYGDNADSGTMAQRLAACEVRRASDGTNPLGEEVVA